MNCLVTGDVGAGKTSWCRDEVSRLARAGVSAGGILSLAVFEDGVKTGYEVLDIRTGRTAMLGRVIDRAGFSGERVGMYVLSESGLAFGRRAIEEAVENGCEVVFLDEMGHLELTGRGFAESASLAYRNATRTVSVVRRSLLPEYFRTFFPSTVRPGDPRISNVLAELR
ncbi:nucleoside-triphosphatase [Dehalogenimonas sp. THU2]|uniref:nucleoside-triphosphatase n=1 Tax=Dehalogenimonas sp. THU2 TaxID=3151121 RepID=UPI0032186297